MTTITWAIEKWFRSVQFTFAAALTFSSILFAGANESSDVFRYGYGSRALSLGGAYNSVANDSVSLYYNPAGLAELRQAEVSANWSSLMAGAQYGGVTAAMNAPKDWNGSFAAGLLGLISPTVQAFSQEGFSGNSFAYSEFKISAGYGGLVPFLPNLRYGFAMKGDLSTLGTDSRFSFRLDAGVQLHLGEPSKLRFQSGFVAKDILSLETGEGRSAVASLGLGAALILPVANFLEVKTPVDFSLELSEGNENTLAASGGLEAVFWKRFAIRAGVDSTAQISVGGGLELGVFRLDYALVSKSMALTHNLSLTTSFGKSRANAAPVNETKPPVPTNRTLKKIAFVIGASLYDRVDEKTIRELVIKNPGYEMISGEPMKGEPEEVWSHPDLSTCAQLAEKLSVSRLMVIFRNGDEIRAACFDAEKKTLTDQGLTISIFGK
ncbi:MAG: hypothetical protein JNM63_14100 [Spirochaetia bacterium]|nr:hypothetical protein [Spirochaetia bacterium]